MATDRAFQSITVPRYLYDRVKYLAALQGVPQNVIIQRAIDAYTRSAKVKKLLEAAPKLEVRA